MSPAEGSLASFRPSDYNARPKAKGFVARWGVSGSMSKKSAKWLSVGVFALAATVFVALVPSTLRAQATRPTTEPAAGAADDPLVGLNLPENAPLKVLIDYVSQEFSLNILYDEQVGNQRITIKAPAKLPRSAVPTLLDSALRMRGLSMIDAGQPGWRRVVPLQQAARVPG